MLPSIARVTLIWCDTSLRVTLRRAPFEIGLDDVHAVEPLNARFQRLPGRDTLIDRSGETLKHLVAQQRPQRRLVAFRKPFDDDLESGARAFDEVSRVEARIGATNSFQPLCDDIGLPACLRRAV